MEGDFLLSSNEEPAERNIYADRSSLILDWLLRKGTERESFSLREVYKDIGVSLGLLQGVSQVLVQKGLLEIQGVRTAKSFSFKKPKELLKAWLDHYSIVKKCKLRTYRSALSTKTEWLNALKQAGLEQDVMLALHSAAEAHGYKNTNLKGLELYLAKPSVRLELESVLQLEPQEKGYEILLIEPYYKIMVTENLKNKNDISPSPLLLTFLDLYHFPLRGQEQAEFIAQRAPEIKRIYNFSHK